MTDDIVDRLRRRSGGQDELLDDAADEIEASRKREAEAVGEASRTAADFASLLALLARIRIACGDNGRRMHDKLEQYVRELKTDAERYRWAIEGADNLYELLRAVLVYHGDVTAINESVDELIRGGEE